MAWEADDQGKAIAWQIEQRGKCNICGTYAFEHDDGPGYEADGLHCYGCEALEIEKIRRADSPQTPGDHLVLYPKGAADGS